MDKKSKKVIVIHTTEEMKKTLDTIRMLISPIPKYSTYESLLRYFIALHNAYSENIGIQEQSNALLKLERLKRKGVKSPYLPKYKQVETEFYKITD